jgi:hypothetical protein
VAKQATGLIVQRNTAVALNGIVTQPACGLLASDVPEGTRLFGFDPSLPDNERLVFLTDDEPTMESDDFIGKPFQLVTWACKRITQVNSDTGEPIPAVRVVLISDMNDTISFVSMGVLASLDLLRTLKGDGPYIPSLPITVKTSKTNRGFRMYKIQPYYAS